MDCLAALFAAHIRPGDCYCLFGAVGAGKSVFSRAFIRAVAEDDYLPVPSPTFLLQNTYDEHQGPPIHHFDFYRLTSVQDFNRLDLEGSLTKAVCLMEWPERLPTLPDQCLAVHIEVVDSPPHLHVAAPPSSTDATVQPHAEPTRPRALSRGRAYAVQISCDIEGDVTRTYSCLEDVETEAEADDFTDHRPRLVTLTPHGSYWEGRARRIMSYIAAHSHACDGLQVLDDDAAATTAEVAAAATAASYGSRGGGSG